MEHISPRGIRQHIKSLQAHLARENPILLEVVKSFRTLDRVAYRLGLLPRNESLAIRVPWWPMISVLGTFSSGKSTFINGLLGEKLQLTGNQAVDDRFTVICYAGEGESHTLPGRALDADPRFPFFQMSRQVEAVAAGEGRRIDAYLQLKTTASERARGKILIDSPGFDADEQRTATLRIVDHIIDLSDLVLVFFDARHPEPGAMQDTLEHLVTRTIHRPDSSKFLFVLNQIDNAAREDNPEEVFGAWQRALAQKGLTAGRFYAIYSPEEAIPIEDPGLRERFESKREQDMAAIEERIERVEVERAYRIIGVLEQTAKSISDRLVPRLRAARERWKRRALWLDGIVLGGLALGALVWGMVSGRLRGFHLDHPLEDAMTDTPVGWALFLGGIALVLFSVHLCLRQVAAQTVVRDLVRDPELDGVRDWAVRAFERNSSPWRSLFRREPVGYGLGARRRLTRVLNDCDRYVQTLNNRFADPSGRRAPRHLAVAEPVPEAAPAASAESVVKPFALGPKRQ